MKITVVRPSLGHKAYEIAANTFISLAKEAAGADCLLLSDAEYKESTYSSELTVLIGSDSVNNITAELYLTKKTDSFKIRYCTDDYCIRTVAADGKNYLIFAGGRPRSTIYSVYRYFELFLSCRWFWDGDRIKKGELVTEGIDLVESPRFDYRGLRYFAHRSLHRFQAEHWSFEDWQAEIDWMLKKRLNLFMLRIGLDDIFQKAFPDTVSYPDRDKTLPEAGKGYDDRTLFWSLEYRGELRKKILAYAFERDLMHPEDCGTMTHWYSRTPYEFLEKKKPKMLPQATSGYSEPTGLVWDVRKNENLNNYFKLTDTHVKEYGNGEIFHTIGLGERRYSDDPEENRRMKLYVYRRIASYIKENYPNAPLLIASWDLWMHFAPEEVRELVGELDPSQSLILDYTSDTMRRNNFTEWNVCGNFPWIFGIFSGYEPESDIRGFYELTNERLKIAKDDPACRGAILWSELSHGDPLIIEYLALNAWDKETLSVGEFTDKYCADRYDEENVGIMQELWRDFMPIVSLTAWSTDDTFKQTGELIFARLERRADFNKDETDSYRARMGERPKYRELAADILNRLSKIEAGDEQMRRDLYDIARTVMGRYIDAAILKAELHYLDRASVDEVSKMMASAVKLLKLLTELLASHEDYSLYESLKKLESVTETNPNFEETLKNNAECGYCRSYIYENAEYLYLPELEHLFCEVKNAVCESREIDKEALAKGFEEIRRRYFALPLEEMDKRKNIRHFAEITGNAAEIIGNIKL